MSRSSTSAVNACDARQHFLVEYAQVAAGLGLPGANLGTQYLDRTLQVLANRRNFGADLGVELQNVQLQRRDTFA